MRSDLCRLVYYSRTRGVASVEGFDLMVGRILATSRRNNTRVGVTGALMFNSGCFAQVLEGPAWAVEQTFERIQQDDRHGDVAVLSFGAAEARTFQQWSMAFVGASDRHAHRYGDVAIDSGFNPAAMNGEALFATLQRLVLAEETALG